SRRTLHLTVTLFPYPTLFRSFEPGLSDVLHTYRPSVGGTVAVTFMPEKHDEYAVERHAEYAKKYCVDDNLVATLRKKEIQNDGRSEEHTSELQSRENLVCRLL